jgi:5'-nucleotidase
MRILLTNDDGIDAFGLKVLYDIASALSDDVWVCAPMLEQSGKGRGVSLHDPVRVRRLGEKRFAAGGTPTDCVQIAISDLMDSPPDLLLSGVNRGFNLAQDVTLSGTVAGALQGMSLGIPSIALSQCLDFDLDIEVIMNINFPDCGVDEVTGVEVTRQGIRNLHEMHAVRRTDPRGRDYYWIDFHAFEQSLIDGTDLKAVAEKRISVTPLHLDLTHNETLHRLKKTLGGVAPKKVEPIMGTAE